MNINKASSEQLEMLKISNVISKIFLFAMIALAFTPVMGLIVPITGHDPLVTLFQVKAITVKVIGFACLLLGLYDLIIKSWVFGPKATVKNLFLNPWNILFLFVLIWGVISFKKTTDVSMSVWGYAYTFEGFSGYLSYFGIYLSASAVIKDTDKKKIFNWLLIGSIAIAIFTLLRERLSIEFILYRSGYCFPYSGTYINPNHYGYYLCVAGILSAALFTHESNKKWKIFYFIAFFINVMTLCLNCGFGSYLALLFGIAFMNLFSIIRDKKKHLVSLLYVDFIFLALTIGCNYTLLFVEFPDFFKSILSFMFNMSSSNGDIAGSISGMTSKVADGRETAWSTAIKAITTSPIFGWGPDRAYYVFSCLFGLNSVPHNEFLQVGVCMGIPAMCAYAAAILWIIIRSFRKFKKMPLYTYISALAVGTYAISSIFGISQPIHDCIFFMSLGLLNSWYASNNREIELN